MDLSQVIVRPVQQTEESRFKKLMGAHLYLGALPKIGSTIWYIATWNDAWIALIRHHIWLRLNRFSRITENTGVLDIPYKRQLI